MEQQEPRVRLPPLDQIGIVVRDMDRAIEYYSVNFGWGPFKVHEREIKGFTYRGTIGNCRLKMAFAQSGSIEIELIQVLEGETPHSEFLREKGEGVQHLRCSVDDIDYMLAELAKEGIVPVFQQSLPQFGVSWAYLNTDKVGGVMLELIQWPKSRSVNNGSDAKLKSTEGG